MVTAHENISKVKATCKNMPLQTVDKVRGDAADFSCAEVPQIQYLSGVEALFMV